MSDTTTIHVEVPTDWLADNVVGRKVAEAIGASESFGIAKKVEAEVDAQLSDAVAARIAPLIEEAVKAPIKRTNRYGEPTGDDQTFTEFVAAAVDTYMTAKVASNGEAARMHNDKAITRSAWLVRSSVEALIKEQVTELLKQVDIKQSTADAIAKLVTDKVKIR